VKPEDLRGPTWMPYVLRVWLGVWEKIQQRQLIIRVPWSIFWIIMGIPAAIGAAVLYGVRAPKNPN
jgi:hypothetical protein